MFHHREMDEPQMNIVHYPMYLYSDYAM